MRRHDVKETMAVNLSFITHEEDSSLTRNRYIAKSNMLLSVSSYTPAICVLPSLLIMDFEQRVSKLIHRPTKCQILVVNFSRRQMFQPNV